MPYWVRRVVHPLLKNTHSNLAVPIKMVMKTCDWTHHVSTGVGKATGYKNQTRVSGVIWERSRDRRDQYWVLCKYCENVIEEGVLLSRKWPGNCRLEYSFICQSDRWNEIEQQRLLIFLLKIEAWECFIWM